MTENPFKNAFLALAYIIILVSLLFLGSKMIGGDEESILYPISALSVLVLSVGVMAYLFFYKPVLMLLDGERERGVKLFLHTLGIFACATGVVLLVSLIVNG
jgi:hypothetical protein